MKCLCFSTIEELLLGFYLVWGCTRAGLHTDSQGSGQRGQGVSAWKFGAFVTWMPQIILHQTKISQQATVKSSSRWQTHQSSTEVLWPVCTHCVSAVYLLSCIKDRLSCTSLSQQSSDSVHSKTNISLWTYLTFPSGNAFRWRWQLDVH